MNPGYDIYGFLRSQEAHIYITADRKAGTGDLNLLANAVKYSLVHKQIEVTVALREKPGEDSFLVSPTTVLVYRRRMKRRTTLFSLGGGYYSGLRHRALCRRAGRAQGVRQNMGESERLNRIPLYFSVRSIRIPVAKESILLTLQGIKLYLPLTSGYGYLLLCTSIANAKLTLQNLH